MNPLTWFPRFLTFFFSPGFKTDLQPYKKPMTLLAALLAVLVAAWGLHHLQGARTLNPSADSIDFEAAVQARVTHAKLWISLVLLPMVPFLSILEWQVLDRTRLWARLTHFTDIDHEGSEASKSLGACVIFGVLLFGNFILISSVLR